MTGDAPTVFFTIMQIAEALGRDYSVVRKRADREAWPFEQIASGGGRPARMYTLQALPLDVRRVLVARTQASKLPARELPPQKSVEEKVMAFQSLSGWKRDKTDPKVEVYLAIKRQRDETGCSWTAALQDYNSGLIYVTEGARAARQSLSWQTFERWRARVNAKGLAGLAPEYGNRAGTGLIDTSERTGEDGNLVRLADWIVGVMLNEPQIKAQHMYTRLGIEWPEVPLTVSLVGAWMKRWKEENAADWLRVTNPDAFKSKYQPAFGSHFENIERVNQLWEMDSSPADWMLKDGRHTAIQCVDLKTRRRRFLVSKTSSGIAVGLLLRRCIAEWGVPEELRTDNGLDYAGSYVETFLENMEIEADRCDAYESQQKGTVERGFRTVFHSILESLPGFIGHNVAQRKAIESRKSFAERREGESAIDIDMDSAELQKHLDDWSILVYERDAQDALGKRSPFEVAAASRDPVRRVNERALDMLLMPIAGTRKVGKKGIQWDANPPFIHPLLAQYSGEDVLLRHDPANAGHLYVYSLQEEFICRAECPELLGMSRKEIAVATSRVFKKEVAARNEELRKAKKLIKRRTAEIVIEHRREEAGVVTMMPVRTVEHTTPALRQAARAAEVRHDAPLPPTRATERPQPMPAPKQAAVLPFPMRAAAPAAPAPTQDEDLARWLARLAGIDARLAAGEAVSEIDATWRTKFMTKAVYLAHMRLKGALPEQLAQQR